MAISRRDALKLSGLAVAGTAISGCTSSDELSVEQKTNSATDFKAPLPDTGKKRVVVLGGGWSGLSVAKYTKVFAPDAEVILVE